MLFTQATVHRIGIADEGQYERKAAVSEAENITTIRREMETLGAPWLNILKMVLSIPCAPSVCELRPICMCVSTGSG